MVEDNHAALRVNHGNWLVTMQMHNKPGVEQDELAQKAVGENQPFIKAVTELSDKREVLASEDIYASNGMKLVNRGTRLTGGFYDRLVAHKLLKPIEQSLRIEDPLDSSKLVILAHEEAHRVPSLEALLGQPQLLERLEDLFGELTIPDPLVLKLAVMQEERPKLFQHSLISTVIATVLGIRGNLPREQVQALALASIFHDIGELCIDPAYLASGHQITMDERRHLYVHPITGCLMLRDFPELPKGVANAVLQHHERLDGTGYPYRLSGEQIAMVPRYLAVAEVAASMIEKHGADKRISMKFRMNVTKFDASAVTIISGLFGNSQMQPAQQLDGAHLMTRLTKIGQLFEDWGILRKTFSGGDLEALSFLVDRMDSLHMLVLEPGFDQCRLDDILTITGEADPEICTELTVLLDELDWQFKALSRGVERDQTVWGVHLPAALKARIDGWLAMVRQCVGD